MIGKEYNEMIEYLKPYFTEESFPGRYKDVVLNISSYNLEAVKSIFEKCYSQRGKRDSGNILFETLYALKMDKDGIQHRKVKPSRKKRFRFFK